MTSATPAHPKIIIGASIPRSGHHFLQGMMSTYYDRDLFYCEYYSPANCCRTAPCTRRGKFKYIYQKSHDRDFALPPDIGDALYLIQYRHPVAEALSDRELELKDTIGRPNLNFRQSQAGYLTWLAGKAIYYRKFHDKWLATKRPNAIYLDYAKLSGAPADEMRAIIDRVSGPVDEARLANVVTVARGPRVSTVRKDGPAETFKQRVVSDSPHFDAELLGALEAWVLDRCPSYGFARELSGSYRDSALYGMILLKDTTEPLPEGETKRFKAAAKLAPDQPEILRRIALRTLREGHAKQAIARLEKLIARHPYFPGAYGLLFSACADAGIAVPESVLTGNALIACNESPELLLQLGAAFQEKVFALNAISAYSAAAFIAPDNPEARERLAAAISHVKR